VLHAVAQIIKTSLRETDIVCRFGGEEFVVIAVQTDGRHAVHAAEKVRKFVEEARFDGEAQLRTTISAGISNYPFDGKTRGQLLKAADLALYSAKECGRNCVVTHAESGAAVLAGIA
jgi:diguanylate cyclase (GGDEF)-like protein